MGTSNPCTASNAAAAFECQLQAVVFEYYIACQPFYSASSMFLLCVFCFVQNFYCLYFLYASKSLTKNSREASSHITINIFYLFTVNATVMYCHTLNIIRTKFESKTVKCLSIALRSHTVISAGSCAGGLHMKNSKRRPPCRW